MIRTCNNCGQLNRVSSRHLANQGRCGKCKAALPPLSEPLDVDEGEFRDIIENSPVPILIDFWAAWCGPCRMAAPEVKKVAHSLSGKAIVLKVDTEKHPRLAAEYRVSGIPHFVVTKGGRVVTSSSGLVDHRQMARWLTEAGA